MAAGAIAAVIASGVGPDQPLHPTAQVAVGLGADHQVEVVGHQARVMDREHTGGEAQRLGGVGTLRAPGLNLLVYKYLSKACLGAWRFLSKTACPVR